MEKAQHGKAGDMRAIFSQWGKDVLNKGASLSGKNILSITFRNCGKDMLMFWKS